jgi:hypothetical protein
MTTTRNSHTPATLLACIQCGEVTWHVCPCEHAPLGSWICEYVRSPEHARERDSRDNVIPLFGRTTHLTLAP